MPNFGEQPVAETPKATDVPKKPVTFQEDLDEAHRALGKSLADGMDADQEAMKKQWADIDAHYGASSASAAPEGLKNPSESVTTGESASLEVSYAVSKFEAVGLSREDAMAIGKLIQEKLNGGDNSEKYFGTGIGPGNQIRVLEVDKSEGEQNLIRVRISSGTKDFPDQVARDAIMMKNNNEWSLMSA